jgi:hypothetical protein
MILSTKIQRAHTIWHNKEKSTYAQHILNRGHTYGDIHSTMEIIRITKKEDF